jgi:hypothetical protein
MDWTNISLQNGLAANSGLSPADRLPLLAFKTSALVAESPASMAVFDSIWPFILIKIPTVRRPSVAINLWRGSVKSLS